MARRYLLMFSTLLLLHPVAYDRALAAYGDWSSALPAWLDQSETSGSGNYITNFTDDVHHSAPYAGGADGDGDGLPDNWETDFIGNTGAGQNTDTDADGYGNLAEFNDGSWPNEDYFRPLDTIAPDTNASGQNLIAQDVIDVLNFCEGRYAAWGFNAPWGLPLNVHIRYTPYGGWGNVNPLWCSPDIVEDLTNPDRKCVAIHELFHNVQRAYPDTPGDTKWFIEGSARMSQDYFYTDNDHDDASMYAGEVRGFLGNHNNKGLFERSYSAVFFWKYLCEQTDWGTIAGQPSQGFDAMDRFMRDSQGLEANEALQQYLDGLPEDRFWYRKPADHFFANWSTALYTRQFAPASLTDRYYYKDEQENLPTSLERPVEITNCAYSPATDSYSPETIPLNGSVLYNDMNNATWTQHLDTWRSRYYAFKPDAGAKIALVWVDGNTGQRNYYAAVTSDAGNVTDISFSFGEDLLKAYFNRGIDELGVVVTALDDAADYDLMVWTLSDFWINIVYPTNADPELVRIPQPEDLSTFDVHLKVWTEKAETPDDDIFVDGLSPDLFEVLVDGEPAQILSGHQMMDEYWLVCAAPELPVGDYDLEVRLLDRNDSEIDALQYRELPHVDRMVVIDRSGSMGSAIMGNNEKMMAAKSGGRLYTDLLVDKDMLGLVSFGGDLDNDPANATLHKSLSGVTDAYKLDVKDAIDNSITDDPDAYEHTAMGQGILAAYNELKNQGAADDDWRIALLTDGIEDRAPYWADATVSGVVVPTKVKIDAIALGSGAHEHLLKSIADDTEGDYYHVSVPMTTGTAALRAPAASEVDPIVENRIAEVFRRINEKQLDHTRIWSAEGVATPSVKKEMITLYEGMGNLILSVNWPIKSGLKHELYRPSGGVLSPVYKAKSHAVYHLPVEVGEWPLELSADSNTPYLAVLSGRGTVKGKLFFLTPDDSTKIGSVQKICFSLIDKEGLVEDTQVFAMIVQPDGFVSRLELFDNGDHGDFAPADNVFCRDYRRTPVPGSYDVKVVAEGYHGKYPFRMEQNGSIVIAGDNDRDKDGMPDEWETRYGLQPSENDAVGDKDNDGVVNIKEFESGGHPGDEDTDNGGTQDGSELNNGMDVFDFSDDRIGPPPALVINQQPTDAYDPDIKVPSSGTNMIYWSRGKNYATVDIYRATSSLGPYVLIKADWPAEKRPYEDGALVNGNKYFYRITAKNSSGIMSRQSQAAIGIPKADNLAPLGSVRISGAKNTVSLLVNLKLLASADTILMRLSNTSNFEGSVWEAFKEERLDWKIGGRYGANFVYVQFTDAHENISLPFSDAVHYQKDSDGDGLGDDWEIKIFKNLTQKGSDDPDKDELQNLGEFENDTDPLSVDTDKDEMNDAWEVRMKTKPTAHDAQADYDKDGATNIAEFNGGTDPRDPKSHPAPLAGDVDGDGKLSLGDAMKAILLSAGKTAADVNKAADVSGDGKIGIAEAIYVIRKLTIK